jgi:hypothetical protein
MSKGSISLKILESNSQIKDKIYEAILQELNKRVFKNKKNVTTRLQNAVKRWIEAQPEIASLRANSSAGSLGAQFGLTSATSDVVADRITSAVAGSMIVKIQPIKKTLKGTLEINFQRDDFINLLSLQSGHVLTEKGTDLHWLDWLLIKGDTTIITGYTYSPGPLGRSGGGEMNIGGLWRVPPEFSGTITNNFITRSFKGTEKETAEILKGLLL